MKRAAAVILLFCAVAAGAAQGAMPERVRALAESLPPREVDILLGVGREYGLGVNELKLLLAVRKIENGAAGIEMGVASNFPRHRARRYAGDLDNSLLVQARWAAGTIRKHYTGDLEAFARRYCPPKWKHWANMAGYWMNKE